MMTNDFRVIFTIEEAIGELSSGLANLGKQPLTDKELLKEVEVGLIIGFEVLEELTPKRVYSILNTDAFQLVTHDPEPLQAFHLNVAVEAVRHYLEASGGKSIPYSHADVGFLPTIVLIFKENGDVSNARQIGEDLP